MDKLTGVLDVGIGNVGSIMNMLKRVGSAGLKVNDPRQLDEVGKLIIPGVGSFDEGITKLQTRFSLDALNAFVNDRKCPTLGICLGMQLLGGGSEEGDKVGLGYIPGFCKHFVLPIGSNLRIPNMGWNEVAPVNECILFPQSLELPRYYFTHSYYFDCDDISMVVGRANFGGEYTAAVQRDNVFGVQFHPEKSHKFGMALFQRFMDLDL